MPEEPDVELFPLVSRLELAALRPLEPGNLQDWAGATNPLRQFRIFCVASQAFLQMFSTSPSLYARPMQR